MSYTIEYQWGAFRIAAGEIGAAEDRYVVAIENGSNNCYDHSGRNARRARSWSACMIGTAEQVLMQAVSFAGDCEGGMLKPGGRDCSPESYIRRIRRLLAGPEYLSRGCWLPEIRVEPGHPVVAGARAIGLEPREEQTYGSTRSVIDFPRERLAEYFALVDRHIEDLPAWSLAQVRGLPDS